MKPNRVTSLPPDYAQTVRARIAAACVPGENGCWLWTRQVDRCGYGKISLRIDGQRRHTGAHRASYLAHVGPILDDLVIDHLCRVPACCNPAHMELVTNQENGLRGDHSGKKGRSGRKRGVPPGCGVHGLADGHWYAQSDGYIRWVCRPCQRRRSRDWRRRRVGS